MSKLFFDHLLELDKLDNHIKQVTHTQEEREELWLLVDEIIHHKVLDVILEKLPRHHHEEFLHMVHKAPHDEKFLFDYLKEKVDKNIEEIIKQELGDIWKVILKA